MFEQNKTVTTKIINAGAYFRAQLVLTFLELEMKNVCALTRIK